MWAMLQMPLLFGLIAASVTTLGLFLVSRFTEWSLRYASLFALAAAGMLCIISFLHIMPEAYEMTGQAPNWVAGGFFVGLVLNYTIRALFPHRPESTLPSEAVTPILAIAAHSFIDGIIYSVTFAASFESGLLASLSLILHELPEGVIAYVILKRHNVSNRSAFLWAFLAAAATTPLGVLVSGPLLSYLDPSLLGALFALSAGLLIFVATGPLLVPLRDTPPARGISAVIVGAVIGLSLMTLPFGHHHGHGHGHHGHNHGPDEHHSAKHDFRDGHVRP
ncbi:MAG: ZIP family metal transporter [Pseudomonadota bacterium]